MNNNLKTSTISVMKINILIFLSAAHLVTDLTAGALPVLLPIIQQSFNLSYSAAGVIPLLFNISSSVVQPLLGFASDKFKSRFLIPLGCFLSMTGLVLIGIAQSYLLVLLAVLLSGLGIAAFHPEASKNSRLASGYRLTTGMSIFIVGGAIGAALGSIITAKLLYFFSLKSITLFIFPAILMTLLFFLFKNKLPKEHDLKQKTNNPNNYKTSNSVSDVFVLEKYPNFLIPLVILIILIIIRSWIQSGITHFMPLYYVNHMGHSSSYVSSLVVSFMLAGIAGVVLGGQIADKFGRKNTLVVTSALLCLLMLMLNFSTGVFTLILFFIIGMLIFSTMATTIVIGQQLMPHRLGMASGLMTGFAVGMGGVGTLILGTIADSLGANTAFWVLILLPFSTLLLSFMLPNK